MALVVRKVPRIYVSKTLLRRYILNTIFYDAGTEKIFETIFSEIFISTLKRTKSCNLFYKNILAPK